MKIFDSSRFHNRRLTADGALRALVRLMPNEQQRLFALTLVIGGVCGLAAVAFHGALIVAEHWLIKRPVSFVSYQWIAWIVIVPTLGALVSGILLHYVVPEARGSGIPQVKFIYAVKSGRVRLRDAAGKFFVSILQIGTGSALGREGPTVHICAGIATALGRMFAISPRNMRRLIPVGSAAGIAAAFNAPIAAVTFTIEEIVGDLDQTLLSGVVVAAALAAVIERSVLGTHPLFDVPGNYGLTYASSLLIYVGVGAAAAVMAHAFYEGLLRTRARVRQLKSVAPWAQPAIGGLATGLLAASVMLAVGSGGVTGDGYSTLSSALSGGLGLQVMLTLAFAKLVSTVLCYSTGGAGGIFAPVLFIGGMIGGCFGHLDHWLLSHENVDLGAFALVGMGAFFAAVIRAPMTSVLIIFEMTRSYGLILPLMIANSVAFVLARSLYRVPIYEALLEQDGRHLPTTQRTAAAISALTVADAMTHETTTLMSGMTVGEAVEVVKEHPFTKFPVVNERGNLVGIVTESRLRRRLAENRGDEMVSSFARAEEYLRVDQPLVDALVRMHKLGARQMAVVDTQHGVHVVGVLAMSDVMRAHARVAIAQENAVESDDSAADSNATPVSNTKSAQRAMLSSAPPPQKASNDEAD